jgi:hypothetical protein
MWKIENHYRAIVGNNIFVDTPHILAFEGIPLFSMMRRENDGRLSITFDLFNKTGDKIAVIRQNRIYPTVKYKGDFSFSHKADRYILTDHIENREVCRIIWGNRAKPGELLVSVEMYMPNGLLIKFATDKTTIRKSEWEGNLTMAWIGINVMANGEINFGVPQLNASHKKP